MATRRISRTVAGLVVGMLAVTAAAMASAGAASAPAAPASGSHAATAPVARRQACVYTRHQIDALVAFGKLVGRNFNCAVVYNDAAPTWAGFEKPWFVVHSDPNLNWAKWATAVPGRRLIVTQSMIPDEAPADWRIRVAAGEYDEHARALARNLVAAGLGSSVIRLGHEANGTWYRHSIGSTQADFIAWRTYWARVVTAMRSVPGAAFQFDLCINAGYRPIAFADYYPGDAYVDIMGIDFYDVLAVPATTPWFVHWLQQYNQRASMRDLLQFARQHGKRVSIPEWAVTARGSFPGFGDDDLYVDALADIVRSNPVEYQSYFLSPTGNVGMMLQDAPKALAAYRRHFGGGGDAAG